VSFNKVLHLYFTFEQQLDVQGINKICPQIKIVIKQERNQKNIF